VLSSQEVHDIAVALGVDPGSENVSGLRYGKVCILADADSDGDADEHTDEYTDEHPDQHADGDADGHADQYADEHPDEHPDEYGYRQPAANLPTADKYACGIDNTFADPRTNRWPVTNRCAAQCVQGAI